MFVESPNLTLLALGGVEDDLHQLFHSWLVFFHFQYIIIFLVDVWNIFVMYVSYFHPKTISWRFERWGAEIFLMGWVTKLLAPSTFHLFADYSAFFHFWTSFPCLSSSSSSSLSKWLELGYASNFSFVSSSLHKAQRVLFSRKLSIFLQRLGVKSLRFPLYESWSQRHQFFGRSNLVFKSRFQYKAAVLPLLLSQILPQFPKSNPLSILSSSPLYKAWYY